MTERLTAKAYDSKCLDLARHFGTGDPDEQLTESEMEALAGDIQDTVETFFDWRRSHPPEPKPDRWEK